MAPTAELMQTQPNQIWLLTTLWSWLVYEGHWTWDHKEVISAIYVSYRWARRKVHLTLWPKFIAEVSATVNGKIEEHAEEDRKHFAEIKDIVAKDQLARQREIALAIQEHVATMHARASGD